VTSDGVVSPANIVDQIGTQLPQRSYFSLISNPALAFDGKQFVLACALPETGDSYPFADAYTSLVTERLGLNGELIPGSRFIRPPERGESGAVSLATNGSQDLIAFRNGTNRLQILLLDHGFFFRTTPLGSLFSGWGSNLEFHGETAVTWNGNEFVVARSSNYGTELIQTSKFGVEGRTEFVSRDPDEQSRGHVFPPSSPVRQPFPPETDPLGLVTRHPAYDSVPRAELLFASDVAALFSRQNPATPVIVSAIGDEDGATVTWKPQDHVLGFMIELRQSDGTDRLLSVASGSASSAHVSYAGLTGTTLHLRAWTADSISPPTLDMQPTAVRRRAVR